MNFIQKKQIPELFKPGSLELGLNYWASHAATRMWTNGSRKQSGKILNALQKPDSLCSGFSPSGRISSL